MKQVVSVQWCFLTLWTSTVNNLCSSHRVLLYWVPGAFGLVRRIHPVRKQNCPQTWDRRSCNSMSQKFWAWAKLKNVVAWTRNKTNAINPHGLSMGWEGHSATFTCNNKKSRIVSFLFFFYNWTAILYSFPCLHVSIQVQPTKKKKRK